MALACVSGGLLAGVARADVVSFGPSGFEQLFTVPAGVTSVHVVASGGRGGGGSGTGGDAGTGGFGAVATADVAVTPGQLLYVEVGTNGGAVTSAAGGAAGFNGGGAGGAGIGILGGGGGGGASDVRTLPLSVAGSLSSRLIVAAGGGGGGGFTGPNTCPMCPNVAGGGPGADGTNGVAPGGGGATPTQAGIGGGNGQSGGLGGGGGGGAPAGGPNGGGGGGGGGAYGGGGGGAWTGSGGGAAGAGGGGGSSTFAASASNTSVAVDATGVPSVVLSFSPAPPPPQAKLTLSGLRVSPSKVSIAGRLVGNRCIKPNRTNSANKHCRRPIKLHVSYTLSVSATVTLTIERSSSGRRVKGRCVKPTKKNKSDKRCAQLIGVPGKIAGPGAAGMDSFAFFGRVGGKQLGPGSYQLRATPKATGASGTPRTVSFRILS